MILFKEDYAKYPGVTIDLRTSNKSALELASKFNAMGVVNNSFHLTIFQPELIGVDAHNPNLSSEIKAKIILECSYNFWYYLREVVRVPAVSSIEPSRLRFNRGNISMYWILLNDIDYFLEQVRQTGKSLGADILSGWLMYVRLWNSRLNLITKDEVLRGINIDRIKEIRDLLPPYLWSLDKADARNSQTITYKARGNVYKAAVGQSSVIAANNVGRGSTAAIGLSDETAFTSNIGTILPAMLAAGTEAREQAQANGLPYFTLYTTTAGRRDTRDGKYAYDLKCSAAPWTELFYDLQNSDKLRAVISKNSRSGKILVNGAFNHRQLGKSDAAHWRAIQAVGGTPDEIDRDFFNIWTNGALSSPLTPKQAKLIFESEEEPVWIEYFGSDYQIRWHISKEEVVELMTNGHVAAGSDTSEAIGNDAIGIVLTDIRTLRPIGVAIVNETNLIIFSEALGALLIKYTAITFVIEKKSTGQMIIDSLLITLPAAGEDPFKRIYNRIVANPSEYEEEYKEITKTPLRQRTIHWYVKFKKYFGVPTTGNIRHLIYNSVLQTAVDATARHIKDAILSRELRGLVIKNGRVDHTNSGNDDVAISWLFSVYFLMQTGNLAYYGIPADIVMSLAVDDASTLTEVDLQRREIHKDLRVKLEAAVQLWAKADSSFNRMLLETKVHGLHKEISLYDDVAAVEIASVNKMLHDAKEAEINLLPTNKVAGGDKTRPIIQSFSIW